jgi:hypothetical protein
MQSITDWCACVAASAMTMGPAGGAVVGADVAGAAGVSEHGPSGRYRGALTSRPAPAEDLTIALLSSTDRAYLSEVWLVRAAMERRVADAFVVVGDALARRGAAYELIQLAARAVDDEYRHAELSRFVASRYAGRELNAPKRLTLEVPALTGASPELRATLHIVGHCVLNETTAAAYLELCLHKATGPTAHWASRELLADEVDHGRLGWGHLAALSPAERAQVTAWLLPLTYLNLRVWRKETVVEAAPNPVFEAHGAPNAVDVEAALSGCLNNLLIPGFEALGLDVAPPCNLCHSPTRSTN